MASMHEQTCAPDGAGWREKWVLERESQLSVWVDTIQVRLARIRAHGARIGDNGVVVSSEDLRWVSDVLDSIRDSLRDSRTILAMPADKELLFKDGQA